MSEQTIKTGTPKIFRGIIFMMLGFGFYFLINQNPPDMVVTDAISRAGRQPMEQNAYNMMLVVASLLGFAGVFVMTLGLKERNKFISSKIATESTSSEQNAIPPAIGVNLPANIPSFIASLGICAAFFMPWITVMGGIGVAGNTLGRAGGEAQLVWGILILAAISALMHFFRPAKPLNVVSGLAPFAILAYFLSKAGSDLFQTMGIGAWVTLVCGIVLLLAPVKIIR